MCIIIEIQPCVEHKGILFSRMDIKHGDCCIRGHYQISMFIDECVELLLFQL